MKRIANGSIIEFYIKEIRRYIYIKYIDVRGLLEDVSYPFQFRIQEKFWDEPVKIIDNLDFSNLLFSPLHLSGFKELIKLDVWKIIGQQEITEYDQKQHQYKMVWPPSLIALFENVKQWRVLENVNNVNEGQIVPYFRCAHLEYAENLGGSHLSLRIIIEYYKSKGGKIDIDKTKWNKFDHVLFSRYINMPVYTQVPDEFKGKLLPEDYAGSLDWLKNIPSYSKENKGRWL